MHDLQIYFCLLHLFFRSYNMTYGSCIVEFVMQKLEPMGITILPSSNVDDQLSQKAGLGGVSIKENCSASPTQNETVNPSDDLLRKLVCFIMDIKEPIPLKLEQYPNIFCFLS